MTAISGEMAAFLKLREVGVISSFIAKSPSGAKYLAEPSGGLLRETVCLPERDHLIKGRIKM